jgi:hypothetical protein
MAVGIGGSPFGDGGHRGVVGLVVVPDDHRQPAPNLAVGEPVGADTRLFERRNDLINHVFDSSLEVRRRSFSKAITCAFTVLLLSRGRPSLPPVIVPREAGTPQASPGFRGG